MSNLESTMYIEAVTVCVNYDDFLAETIRFNAPLLDRWIILTDEKDIRTRDLCRKHNLECILVNLDAYREGNPDAFPKGKLIDHALHHVSADGWRMHLDSDIVLPGGFRHLMKMAMLRKEFIYGVDRILVKGWDEWQRLLKTNWLYGGQYTYQNVVKFPDGFQIGSRWATVNEGYAPIGFMQVWHSSQDLWKGIRSRPYPTLHSTACRTDTQFSMKFDRPNRALIPELIVAHLESEPAALGANWKGRTTKRFGPDQEDLRQEFNISSD